MEEKDLLGELNLPPDPVDLEVRIVVKSTEGNCRHFNVRIERYRHGFGYVELYISVRQIKGIRFDRLLRRIVESKPVGHWLALAQIPARDEDSWIANWEVLEFEPIISVAKW